MPAGGAALYPCARRSVTASVLPRALAVLTAVAAIARCSAAADGYTQCSPSGASASRGAVCRAGTTTSGLVATVNVITDDGQTGSLVQLTLHVPTAGHALPNGWRLCFTWLKAVVLQLPPGARHSGSYVELPAQSKLGVGRTKKFHLRLAPPAMRYASDLPRHLHVVIRKVAEGSGHEEEQVLQVYLIPPTEAHIRFDPAPPGLSGVLPKPLEVESEGQRSVAGFALGDAIDGATLKIVQRSAKSETAAKLLEDWLSSWPLGAPLMGSRDADASRKPTFVQSHRELVLEEAKTPDDRLWFGREGYEVSVSREELRIEAAETDGFHRGAVTLRQVLGLAHGEARGVVPPTRIRDRPRFGIRGVMLDVARHFFPVTFLKRLLDWMYLYKLNVFHWHLTDDEGWRLEVKALPNLTAFGAWRGRGEVIEPQYSGGPGRYGGFYTQDDVRDVVSYAADRGIIIVPEIDVPGHCYAAIRALPQLLGSAVRKPSGGPKSVQGFQANVLDPESPATYTFLEAVFSEVLDLFPAPLGVHIGMDEIPRGAWSANDREEDRLKAKLARWLQRFLAERGRALLGWEEAFYGESGLDPSSELRATAIAWKEDERFAVRGANSGFDIILSPAHFLYLDIVQDIDFETRGLYWATPELPIERIYSYEPIERLERLGLQRDAQVRIRGMQAALWSETVDSAERAEQMLFPRLFAIAEVAWSDASLRNWIDFQWRLAPQLAWLTRDGMHYWNRVCGVLAEGNFMRIPHASSEMFAAAGCFAGDSEQQRVPPRITA